MNISATAAEGLGALRALESYVNSCGLPDNLLDLLRLRVSQINGCSFCVDMHAYDLKQAGEADERIWSVAAWHEAPSYTDAERAALALAEAATRLHDNPGGVSDAVWTAAAAHFADAQLAALILAIASINAWNRINVANRQVAGALRRTPQTAPQRRPRRAVATHAPRRTEPHSAAAAEDHLQVDVDSGVEFPVPADGETWVVGAVILNQNGEAFAHKRSATRRLFPNCWDIVGGHVAPGETLLDALAREVEEETGWRLAGSGGCSVSPPGPATAAMGRGGKPITWSKSTATSPTPPWRRPNTRPTTGSEQTSLPS